MVANDAATLPASLFGRHSRSGKDIEIRLAGCSSLAVHGATYFLAIAFGAGDYHTRTEDRLLPPALKRGDRLELGPLTAHVIAVLHHPRLISLAFQGTPSKVWAGLARHGRPIQYAHTSAPLRPLAHVDADSGSACFVRATVGRLCSGLGEVAAMRAQGIEFATITTQREFRRPVTQSWMRCFRSMSHTKLPSTARLIGDAR